METDALLHTSQVVVVVGGITSVIALIVGAISFVVSIKFRSDTLVKFQEDVVRELKDTVRSRDFEKFRDDVKNDYKELASKFSAMTELLKVQIGRQDVINQVATSALESLERRIEEMEKRSARWGS